MPVGKFFLKCRERLWSVALAEYFWCFFLLGISPAMTCTMDVPSQSDGSGTKLCCHMEHQE